MAATTSLWRPMSPESDIDVEAEDDDVTNDDVTTRGASFRASENSAFSRIAPKREKESLSFEENQETEVPLNYCKNELADDVTTENNDKKDGARDMTKSTLGKELPHHQAGVIPTPFGALYPGYSGHMTNQNNSDVTYSSMSMPIGANPSFVSPMTPYTIPYITNYAAYMAIARLQLQEHQRRLAALSWQQNNQRSRSPENPKEASKSPDSSSGGNSPEISSATSSMSMQNQIFQYNQQFIYRNLQAHTLPTVPPRPLLHPGLVSYGGRPRDPSKPQALKKYKCDVCGKAFSRSNTLVTHKRIHTGEKPFSCELCGRAFRQPGNLTRHRLTHTTVKPYVCLICNKAFNRASNLHTHKRIHEQQHSYACHFCNETFAQKVDLRIHMYAHQGSQHH